MGRYFGTDGIRGTVGEFLNEDLARRLGRSLQTLSCGTAAIGRDTRESGASLAAAVMAGAREAGIDVVDLGVVSTPLLSYASGRLGCIGVMITASHNPFTDNGLKVFLLGKKLFESEESALEDVIAGTRPMSVPIRSGIRLPDIDAGILYDELVPSVLVRSRLKIALDCANGAVFAIAPALFERTGAALVLTGVSPDGRNINLGVGSTHIEHLSALVRSEGCDVGFAFDGDGDRLIAVGRDGEVYDGDLLVYVIATALKDEGKLAGDVVALTKMSNLGLVKALALRGIRTIQTEVGDKFVLEALETGGYTVGGENSGHIIDRTLLGTGDGVLNALHVLKIMTETGRTLAELTRPVVLYPDKLVNLRDIDKTLAKHPAVVARTAAIAARLGSDGKVLVRASGTEPLIRVSVSALDMGTVDAAIAELVSLIRSL